MAEILRVSNPAGCYRGQEEELTQLIEADRLAATALYREAMRRFLKGNPQSLLDAPCMWCAYNGQKYWQKGTHDKECPWHDIGSFEDRCNKLEKVLGL